MSFLKVILPVMAMLVYGSRRADAGQQDNSILLNRESRARASLAALRKNILEGRVTRIKTYYFSIEIELTHSLSDKALESQGMVRLMPFAKDSAFGASLIHAINATKLSASSYGHGDLRFAAVFLDKNGKRLSRIYVSQWTPGQVVSDGVLISDGVADWIRLVASMGS